MSGPERRRLAKPPGLGHLESVMEPAPPPRNDPAPPATPELAIELLGAELSIPPADCWLRAFQTLAAREPRLFFHAGFYCWNDRCKKCFLTVSAPGSAPRRIQACQSAPRPGEAILELPEDMSFEA